MTSRLVVWLVVRMRMSERSLYSMHLLILSQCRDLRMGVVIWENVCKTVLSRLEAIYLRFIWFWKIVV